MHGVLAFSDFHETISLGSLIVAVLVVALFFLGSLKDRQTGRWRSLYELADEERKELQQELDEAREVISNMKEQIAKLEALQMPTEVVRSLHHSADAASARQLEILRYLEKHEENAERRNTAQLNLLRLIADRLGPDPNGKGDHE